MPRLPRIVLPTLSVAGACFAFYTVLSARDPVPQGPKVEPPRNGFERGISGNGIVVPPSERNIELSAPFAALVTKVHVTAGQDVEAGAPLFQLDDRALVAAQRSREAGRDLAKQKLERLKSSPRPEEVPPLEARVAELRQAVADWSAQVARLEAARQKEAGAVTLDDLDRRRFAREGGKHALQRAEAELELMKKGAWSADLALAEAELREAEAVLEQARTEVERACVRAPSSGKVLEVNVRGGEYATPGSGPLVLFADRGPLRVRVDVDEESAPLLVTTPQAYGTLRGFASRRFPLKLVRVEPYVKPKRSLTGDNKERVDTRVLQLVFEVVESPLPVFIGQQMDVFLEAKAREEIATEKPK